jgi:DNA repair protein RecO
MIVTAEGIVLSAAESGESDIIAHVITEEHGVQQLMFKGIRKSRRRSHSAAEPGMRSTFVFRTSSRQIHTVSECTPLDLHEEIRARYERIIRMHFLLEAVLRTAGMSQPDGFLYKMLRGALESIEKDTGSLALPLFFVLRLLIHLGVFPGTPACSRCGAADTSLNFYYADHTLLCGGCAVRKGNILFDTHEAAFIAKAARSRYSQMPPFLLSPRETEVMLSALIDFMEQSFRITLKSKKILFSDSEEEA